VIAGDLFGIFVMTQAAILNWLWLARKSFANYKKKCKIKNFFFRF